MVIVQAGFQGHFWCTPGTFSIALISLHLDNRLPERLMMRILFKIILFAVTAVICLLLNSTVNAQSSEIEKWQLNLEKASNDSVRFQALIKLFSLNAKSKIELAGEYLDKALVIAQKEESPFFMGTYYYQRANYFNYKGKYDSTAFYASKSGDLLVNTPFRKAYAMSLASLSTALGTQNEKRIAILRRVEDIYIDIKDSAGLIWTYNAIASNFTFLNKFDSALYYTGNALDMSRKMNDNYNIGASLSKICNIYFEQQQFDKAIQTGIEALEYHKKSGNINEEIWVYVTLANIFYNQGSFDKSHEYYDHALSLSLSSGINNKLIRIYLEKGNVFLMQKNYQEAIAHFEKAMNLAKEKKSEYYVMAVQSSYADLYLDQKNYIKSIDYARSGYETGVKLDAKTDLPYLTNLIGVNYYHLGNLDSALFYGYRSYSQAVEINDVKKIMDAADLMSKVSESKGDYGNALKYFREYKAMQDSIFSSEKARMIIDSENKFQSARKQEEIQRLLAEQQISKLKLQQKEQQLLLQSASSRRKAAELELAEKSGRIKDLELAERISNDENQKKKIALQQAELALEKKNLELAYRLNAKEKSLRNVSLAAVFITLIAAYLLITRFKRKKLNEKKLSLIEERLRISRELHDDLGSTLSSISVYSDVAKNRALKNAGNEEVLNKISFASRDLIDKMSDIVWSLNPGNETVEQLKNRMIAFSAMILSPNGISFQFDFEHDLLPLVLKPETRKNLYLIFKESVNNIVKHSGAKNVLTTLKSRNGKLVLDISDDGIGFPAMTNGNGLGGNGLLSLKARSREIGGEIVFKSGANGGASVALTFEIS